MSPAEAAFEELEAELGAMGFYNFGVTAPGGYGHWLNTGWMFDEHLVNPEFSESLVYQVQSDGTWKLVSAMFMLDPAIDMEHIPEDIAWLPGWHGHPELCFTGDGTFGGITDPENPDCPEGTTQATTPLMMHVWIVDSSGCNHRFGGIGVGGVHCDHGDDHGEDHGDGGHGDGGHGDDQGGDHSQGSGDHMDDGGQDGGNTAPAATPVVAPPKYTG